jgi:hypothetical protein
MTIQDEVKRGKEVVAVYFKAEKQASSPTEGRNREKSF